MKKFIVVIGVTLAFNVFSSVENCSPNQDRTNLDDLEVVLKPKTATCKDQKIEIRGLAAKALYESLDLEELRYTSTAGGGYLKESKTIQCLKNTEDWKVRETFYRCHLILDNKGKFKKLENGIYAPYTALEN